MVVGPTGHELTASKSMSFLFASGVLLFVFVALPGLACQVVRRERYAL
jgi:hypothetical protein